NLVLCDNYHLLFRVMVVIDRGRFHLSPSLPAVFTALSRRSWAMPLRAGEKHGWLPRPTNGFLQGALAMTYTEKVLQPGETVKFHSKIHWIVYGRGIVFIV